jgi:hypothetical protein
MWFLMLLIRFSEVGKVIVISQIFNVYFKKLQLFEKETSQIQGLRSKKVRTKLELILIKEIQNNVKVYAEQLHKTTKKEYQKEKRICTSYIKSNSWFF